MPMQVSTFLLSQDNSIAISAAMLELLVVPILCVCIGVFVKAGKYSLPPHLKQEHNTAYYLGYGYSHPLPLPPPHLQYFLEETLVYAWICRVSYRGVGNRDNYIEDYTKGRKWLFK